MATKIKKRRSAASKQRFIGKPNGQIQERVKAVGPEHFGIVSVDCAKRRSKWMLCNFYGKVVIEPTTVEHTAGGLQAMIVHLRATCASAGLTETIIAIEMTGIYHRPVQRAFREAGFETRIVHPFASKHYRRVLHPGAKSDDHDLEAIFHAAVNGYGLAVLPVGETYQLLQAASRHRGNLVGQRSRLMVQTRHLLHLTMPGFAELFEDGRLFRQALALPIALRYPSAATIREAGTIEIAAWLKREKVRFQTSSVERVVAWAAVAAEPCELSEIYTRQWRQLNEVRSLLDRQIADAEREMAGFLAKTPYVLLLSVPGVNVVSAGCLAGEAGPIEHYGSARALTGRAGLYPSRYQSDEVDRADGPLVRQGNRQLRGAAMLMAENLIKCHSHYRGLAALWKQKKIDPRDCRCRIANRALRMVYQLVGGRQVWRGQGVERGYLLLKLQEFHREHQTPMDQVIRDLNEAFAWLPRSQYAAEAKPLAALARRKQRGPRHIGTILAPLLLRLGVSLSEPVGGEETDRLESTTSEARRSS